MDFLIGGPVDEFHKYYWENCSPFDTSKSPKTYEVFTKIGEKVYNHENVEKDIVDFLEKYESLDLKPPSEKERPEDIEREALRFFCLSQIFMIRSKIIKENYFIPKNISEKLFHLIDIIIDITDEGIIGYDKSCYIDFKNMLQDALHRENIDFALQIIGTILDTQFNLYLSSIHPVIDFHNGPSAERPKITMFCESLISAIYITYLSDLSADKITTCEICGNILYKNSKNKRVHTECSNRERQKRFYYKHIQKA